MVWVTETTFAKPWAPAKGRAPMGPCLILPLGPGPKQLLNIFPSPLCISRFKGGWVASQRSRPTHFAASSSYHQHLLSCDLLKQGNSIPSPPSPPGREPGPWPGCWGSWPRGPDFRGSGPWAPGISRPGAPGLGPRAWACLSFWTPSNYLPLFFWVNYSIHGPLDPPNGITPPKWSDYNGI